MPDGRKTSRTQAEVVCAQTIDYAQSPQGPLAQRVGSDVSFFIKNPHGDVVGTATSASLSSSLAYSPYGEVLGSRGSTLGYQGQRTDTATGLVDMTTRHYDPTMGRFISQDVLFGDLNSPMSLNQYAYSAGNPVTLWDPTGMVAPQECAERGMMWCRNHYYEWREAKIARIEADGGDADDYNFALGCPDCEDRTVPHVFIVDARGTNYLRQRLQGAILNLDENGINRWGLALTRYTGDSEILVDQVAAANLDGRASVLSNIPAALGDALIHNIQPGLSGCYVLCASFSLSLDDMVHPNRWGDALSIGNFGYGASATLSLGAHPRLPVGATYCGGGCVGGYWNAEGGWMQGSTPNGAVVVGGGVGFEVSGGMSMPLDRFLRCIIHEPDEC